MDSTYSTSISLLLLCRRRAYLLRRALEATVPCTAMPDPYGRWAKDAMDNVDRLLGGIEGDLKAQKEDADAKA